ncbi:MAG: DUF1902 domain-containing protein [Amphiplicatus sp.]
MRSYARIFQIAVDRVEAEGDEPAGYVATNEELGLVVEADSLDELAEKAAEMAGELFRLNILPTLREEATAVPPAFVLQHRLDGGGLKILR